VEPTTRRPKFPEGYGISAEDKGILEWQWARERLAEARNYWICTTSPDGAPHAMPVWGAWVDEAICFGTSPASRKARNLERDPRVVVHLESGDEAVIVEGRADTLPSELFDAVAAEFERKYDWRPEGDGGFYLVRPARAYAWLERSYPETATRFDF
jgi:nitroimidazol reductase NimA-like FMN-containing flavoprotein (pyridoxamine 5'-phosphate oxidase superfamily)